LCLLSGLAGQSQPYERKSINRSMASMVEQIVLVACAVPANILNYNAESQKSSEL